jgi:hypothetical protein
VKMDIEGAELAVLAAAMRWGKVEKLCFECATYLTYTHISRLLYYSNREIL